VRAGKCVLNIRKKWPFYTGPHPDPLPQAGEGEGAAWVSIAIPQFLI